MKHIWLERSEQHSLILFFNGWGNDANPFMHLDTDGFDVLMLYDYQFLDNECSLISDIKSYACIYLIAWSFGVWVSQCFCEKYQIKPLYSVALNGTLCPVNDKYGIAEDVVDGTLGFLNERTLMKFQMRMVGGKEAFEKFQRVKPEINWEVQKMELKALLEHFKKPILNSFSYDKVYIGMQDKIFVPQNQLDFWKDKARLVQINEPHFCFFYFKAWKELISVCQ